VAAIGEDSLMLIFRFSKNKIRRKVLLGFIFDEISPLISLIPNFVKVKYI
jgi:hypothetical protein